MIGLVTYVLLVMLKAISWSSPLGNPGRFRYLLNGVIQEIKTSRCLNLVSPTEQQVILTPKCCGPDLLKWYYNESTQYLVHNETKKCISPWDYSSRLPVHVKYVPGLSSCSGYNKVLIQCEYTALFRVIKCF